MFFEWQGSTPVALTCTDKYHETADTVSIKLAAPSGGLRFSFKPGQFINLGVEIDDKMEFRAYSLSSVNGETHLQLTIKRVTGGKVSNFIIDSLNVGDLVQALPPAGEFNCIDHAPKEDDGTTKALLISAGCGITPVYAMAKHLLREPGNCDITFLHIARSPQETIYYDELLALDSVHDNFHLKLLLKDQMGSSHPQGRLDAKWLQQLVPDFNQRTAYLCGPNQFMLDVQSYLNELGFDMNHFYQESFTPIEAQATDSESSSDAAGGSVNVFVPDFGQTLEAEQGQPLADVLEDAGLPLIVACRSGICGSCKCKVNKGSVTSSSQETLTPEEIEQGYVLACSSTIDSDVEVQLG